MFRLEKQIRFEASHQLPFHDGKCARLHGHSWIAVLILEHDELIAEGPKAGMLLDFGDISAAVKPLLDTKLDHWHLNETLGLINPTSEEIARWLHQQLIDRLPLLTAVRVEETCTSACEYRPA